MDFFLSDEMKDIHVAGGKAFADCIGTEWGHGMSHPFANNTDDILASYDYLRSKSYALPWMDATVEEQIEFGWVKLREV